jgi:hypothetical protein
MARGRFIGKEISLDDKVEALSDDTARLLFTWTIAHLDREGRTYGEPHLVKAQVFPRRNISVIRVEKYLKEMERLGLIVRYRPDNTVKSSDEVGTFSKKLPQFLLKERYIFYPNFEKHQIGLRKDKEAPSVIPPPPAVLPPPTLPTYDGVTSGKGKLSLSKREDKLKIKTATELFLEYDKEVGKLFHEFPDLAENFDSHIKACIRWWTYDSKKPLKDPVKAARNWLLKERSDSKNIRALSERARAIGYIPSDEELDKEEGSNDTE